ncbi:ABC-F family ATP-binding cassette domain-containing protein [Sedimentibacter sp. MB31-C6]|uniref:ABC-F family ATP-binding cassette domain-containing protein n=1 Tax=Sedimentibacter sp. MB31-C6 TaxID=3109366 RepID=UPI002DDD862C|nr:ABC-F family ATP-binding cassette domain-containing protein [Sedimentibacter sp. MB36-C1]WSI05533.1 ABC-F family ATP-binding cassette domain-containing protein [Sedimentibacter sp. MB36-C1]
MSILEVKNVTHGFGARSILEDVSFRLLKGEHVALIGANGEGKSTFLNIITRKLMPDEGTVEWSKRVTVGYLDQHSALKSGTTIRENLRLAFNNLYTMEQEMLKIYEDMTQANDDDINKMMEDAAEIQTILDSSGFYFIDTKVDEVANGLGLSDIGLDKSVDELSGGQRTKVLLTKLLLQNPTILLLDEPTNYLDENHIQWLTNYLRNYENAFILISHDIPFINDVCNIIYHVENSILTRYVGNYEEFKRIYDLNKQKTEREFEKQQKEIEKLEDFIARNKARVATRGMANSRMKQLDKMEILERPRDKPKPSFKFKETKAPSRFLIEAKDLVIGYDSPLTSPMTFEVERNKKIAICGVNGLGKSTLLKTLLGIIHPISGSVEFGENVVFGYFEQEDSKNNSNTALDEVWNEYPSLTNHEVRLELARCGLTTDNITSMMKVLSGGENAKVRLCKLLLKELNFLILDEPTNHLDPEAKDELQKAIKEFKGTVILVSHEPYFYESFITDVWNIEDFTTKIV